MTDFPALMQALAKGNVEFIIVGGLAAAAHGSARATFDIDIVYSRDGQNLTRLIAALSPLHPRLRGAPPGIPFQFDERTLRGGLNFTLTTDSGDIDLLGEIAGGGGFEKLAPHTVRASMFGIECRCLDLPTLIKVKRAAGRPKDFEAIAELEAILEEQSKEG
jgi:hypothetical protein